MTGDSAVVLRIICMGSLITMKQRSRKQHDEGNEGMPGQEKKGKETLSRVLEQTELLNRERNRRGGI